MEVNVYKNPTYFRRWSVRNPKSVSLVIEALEIVKADLEKKQNSKKEEV